MSAPKGVRAGLWLGGLLLLIAAAGYAVQQWRQPAASDYLTETVERGDIAETVSESGTKVVRSQVALNAPIKTLGLHELKIKLHADVSVTVTINIARSQDEAERQAAGEDVIAAQADEDRAIAEAQAAALFEASEEGQELAAQREGEEGAATGEEESEETEA